MHPMPTGILLSSKIRLLAQILVCLYVLAFATLVSVMTGYRAELTGVFDYHEINSTILKPFDGIYRSQMILYDGGRIGLLSNPMKCRGVFDEDDQDGNLDISAYLSLSGTF
jgi:glycopeptide antibiotics resistance protein